MARVPLRPESFFKHYRSWKSFSIWQRFLISRKRQRTERLLNRRLFILHPLLRTALLQLRGLMLDVIERGVRNAGDTSPHSKRSAALGSRTLEPSVGYAIDPSLAGTTVERGRRARRNDAHSSL